MTAASKNYRTAVVDLVRDMTDPYDENGELDLKRLLVSRDRFIAVVEEHFITDGLDDGHMDRLYEGWLEIARSDERFRGQEDMFEPENAGRLHGVGWWESFMAAEEDPELPEPGVEEHIMMYVSSTPATGHVPPYFYCPLDLVATWVLVAEGPRHGGDLPPASVGHTMELKAGGSFTLSERLTDEAARWCVHKDPTFDEIWFRNPDPPHRHEEHILRRVGDDITTERMDARGILRRWSRVAKSPDQTRPKG